jgi:alkylhydroperoxidase family enzyme
VTEPRIAPLESPYPEKTRALFDLVMPEGMEPLLLFRTLAACPRIFPRFMRAGVLDPGPIPIRERELMIHRTTALCGAEYEWGVHVSAFARPLGLSDAWIRATVEAGPDDPIWSPREALLVRLCDALHENADVPEALWEQLRAEYDPAQLVELLYLAGLYHAVSFLAKGLRLPPEPFAERFPR